QKPALVVAALDLKAGQSVADIGAGTGYFLPHLAAAVGPTGRVQAVDIEPTMVRFMLDRAATDAALSMVGVQLGTATDPLLGRKTFDRILIVDTWHHIGERTAYAQRLKLTLRPRGTVVVVDFKLESDRGPKRDHKLAPDVVKQEFEAAGYTATLDVDLLPDQYLVFARPREL
ncbi:MAG: methyltransferase domain-containing protein, partial [Myxococcota bacterium]